MKTKRPIATISYNSELFLQLTLDNLVKDRQIETWAYIRHYAEDDEKKDHIHVFIEPTKSLDTSILLTEFIEPTGAETPPLCCMPFRLSKWQDWYLYSAHNIEYLASKGQYRKHHYAKDMFVFSHEDYYLELIRTIDTRALTASTRFFNAIKDGQTFGEILCSGIVPLQSVLSYQKAYDYMVNHILKERQQSSLENDMQDLCT